MGLLGDIADFGKGVIENNLKWTEHAAKVGEFIASQIGRRLIRAARSPILVAGQQTIESMKHSTGVGDPENGQRFGEGADKMGAVGQVLVSAFPDDSWDSSGASAYAGRNSEQVGRVQTMLGLDNVVAGVLSTEAGQIAATRDSLDGHSDWLGAMSLLTTTAGIVPGFGTAAQMAAEFAMVAKAVGDSNSDLRTLCGHIDENAAVLQTTVAQYETLAGGATSTAAEFQPPAGEPQVPTAPGDPGAKDPGGPTGDDAPSGDDAESGGLPSGGGGGVPSTGGGGGTPSGSSSAPSMPTGMSGTGSPSPDAASNAAGALGGILGSLVSPLSGILGGITQAAGQAAQAATQAGTQAAQMASQAAGQAGGPAADAGQLDKASGSTGVDPDDRDDEDRNGRDEDDEKDEHAKDREKDGEDQVGEPEEGEAGGLPATDSVGGPADPLGAGEDDEAAKTLPPDLEAMAAGGAAAGPAPVHVGADFEQGQLHVAAAATLDRGVPGSAAVIDR
ncbi:EspA/EspE family type VII secretion system effector [Mycobacterium sp. DL440]|uniref:EspA/EspE family type VII secretion system effector n=1 Tax=Mycobacterium sp. DL440 TaxID=2675523 RepID=UPI00141E73D0|nr:EspA/EspE family type VII secretion system effector [Mycobacterium sp. DL440]